MTTTASPATATTAPAAAPSAPPSPPRWSAAELLPPLLSVVAGVLLLLPHHGLWFDELFTAEVVRRPLSEIVAAAVQGRGVTGYLVDVPPSYNAPYYVVAHFWPTLPGLDADTSLRVLSLLAMAGGLALVTRAVTRLAGRAVGVTAGCVLALSPMVVEHSVEARSYGLLVLATGAAALGLTRWLVAQRGLVLLGPAGAGMGLMHWYGVTVLAAFVAAALFLRGRAAAPVALAGAAAVVPVAALVGMNLLNGTGARNAEHLRDTHGTFPGRMAEVWTSHSTLLLLLTVGLAVLGALRGEGVRVLGACWLVVPLVLLLGAELVRPVYLPRYLLAGMLGLGVLAAAGACALPRPARAPVAALLVAATALASWPQLDRHPRERADEVVAQLAAVHRPGEPVVAADQRSALGLDHYVRTTAPQLRPDVVLPPDDPPAGAGRVYLVRRVIDGRPVSTDDDDVLVAAGLHLADERLFPAGKTDLVVQTWER